MVDVRLPSSPARRGRGWSFRGFPDVRTMWRDETSPQSITRRGARGEEVRQGGEELRKRRGEVFL